jgi:hypothetical protein
LSNFDFCPLAWHFCNKSNTSKLEKIQARALRFIYEDYVGIYTILEYLKLYLQSLKTTKSCKQDGESLFKILKHSIAMVHVLKRIGCFLSKLNKLTIFHTFILSNFNFCPLAWHFCNKSNTSKLEKIQARALRFIYEDYESTYDELYLQYWNI